jgi:hypothetical protein
MAYLKAHWRKAFDAALLAGKKARTPVVSHR